MKAAWEGGRSKSGKADGHGENDFSEGGLRVEPSLDGTARQKKLLPAKTN